jgi:hypothetical protein
MARYGIPRGDLVLPDYESIVASLYSEIEEANDLKYRARSALSVGFGFGLVAHRTSFAFPPAICSFLEFFAYQQTYSIVIHPRS